MQCGRSCARSLAGRILLARSLLQKRASECSADGAKEVEEKKWNNPNLISDVEAEVERHSA